MIIYYCITIFIQLMFEYFQLNVLFVYALTSLSRWNTRGGSARLSGKRACCVTGFNRGNYKNQSKRTIISLD